jgi:hypothetical protein
MSIEAFKASFTHGVRPNMFRMEIFGLPEKLAYLCKASQTPGKNVGIIEIPFLNQTAKIAVDVTFEDLTVTVMLDNDFSVRNELEAWMENIKSNDGTAGDDPAVYKQTGSLVHLDNQNQEIAQYDFVGLWPNALSPMDLSFETKDSIAEYTVTFSYDYWLRVS